jgi:hypothetical protein
VRFSFSSGFSVSDSVVYLGRDNSAKTLSLGQTTLLLTQNGGMFRPSSNLRSLPQMASSPKEKKKKTWPRSASTPRQDVSLMRLADGFQTAALSGGAVCVCVSRVCVPGTRWQGTKALL